MNHEHDCRPEQIKEIRKQLNLSQEEFAKKLGVSFTSVNRWENGQTKPSKLARKQIMNLLDFLTWWLPKPGFILKGNRICSDSQSIKLVIFATLDAKRSKDLNRHFKPDSVLILYKIAGNHSTIQACMFYAE